MSEPGLELRMRRRHALRAIAAATLPAACAGCLDENSPGATATSTTSAGSDAPTTAPCEAPSSLECRDPAYDLGPSVETPPVSTSDLPQAERRIAVEAAESGSYVTCGPASALRSLAERIAERNELRAERHVDRWTERDATVTPPAYLSRYYLEHDGRRFEVEIVLDGELRLGPPP